MTSPCRADRCVGRDVQTAPAAVRAHPAAPLWHAGDGGPIDQSTSVLRSLKLATNAYPAHLLCASPWAAGHLAVPQRRLPLCERASAGPATDDRRLSARSHPHCPPSLLTTPLSPGRALPGGPSPRHRRAGMRRRGGRASSGTVWSRRQPAAAAESRPARRQHPACVGARPGRNGDPVGHER